MEETGTSKLLKFPDDNTLLGIKHYVPDLLASQPFSGSKRKNVKNEDFFDLLYISYCNDYKSFMPFSNGLHYAAVTFIKIKF